MYPDGQVFGEPIFSRANFSGAEMIWGKTDSSRRKDFVICALVFCATVIFFSRAFFFDFLSYDDNFYVVKNPFLSGGLKNYFLLWMPGSMPRELLYIPLTYSVFFLEKFFFGDDPFFFHFLNIFLHAANVVLLFTIARTFGLRRLPAGLAALIFAFHPIQIEAVAWVMGMKDLLAFFFAALAVIFYSRWTSCREWKTFVLFFFLSALSMLSKPSAVTLPFVFILSELLLHRCKVWETILRFNPFIILSALVFYLNSLCHPQQQSRGIGQVVSYLPVFVAYWTKQLILPFSGNVHHPWPAPQDMKSLFFCSLLLCAVFVAFFLIAYRKKLITTKIYFIFLSGVLLFLPAASVLSRYNDFFTASRYAYLPMGAFAIFAACIVHRRDDEKMSRSLAIFLSVYILAFAAASQSFLGKWRDGVTLMEAECKKFPFDANVAYYLGVAYQQNEDLDGAILSYTKCVELNPLHHRARINLGVLYFNRGFYEEAVSNFEKALAVSGPHVPYVLMNLGEAYLHIDKVDEALKSFNNALASKGDFHYAATRIYELLNAIGREDEAAKFAESAAPKGLKIDAKRENNEVKSEYIR